MSYNILADLYADSEVSRTQLFPYCPPYALSIDYRKQLILKELLGEFVKQSVLCSGIYLQKNLLTEFRVVAWWGQIYSSQYASKSGMCVVCTLLCDMLPHHQRTYDDVILPGVLT